MSCVLDGKANDVIRTANGEFVVIDTCFTFDYGWETMVFPCKEDGYILDFSELDVNRYISPEDADIGHAEMINKWMKEVLV